MPLHESKGSIIKLIFVGCRWANRLSHGMALRKITFMTRIRSFNVNNLRCS